MLGDDVGRTAGREGALDEGDAVRSRGSCRSKQLHRDHCTHPPGASLPFRAAEPLVRRVTRSNFMWR